MFKNLTENCLWDLSISALKTEDLQTKQLLYKGAKRGQSERFMIVNGSIVKELFDKTESLFDAGDAFASPYSFITYLQRLYSFSHIQLSPVNERLVRNMIDEAGWAWRLKGTTPFLKWIIPKVFGWKLLRVITLVSEVFQTNVQTSFLYDPTKHVNDQKTLYDSTSMLPQDQTTFVIDVLFDPLYAEKRPALERMFQEWAYPAEYSYRNVP